MITDTFVCKPLRLAVIVISTNDGHWLEQCLSSLLLSIEKDFIVFLVDNDCRDKTVDIAQRFPLPIQIISCAKRLGFAAANNLAITKALAHQPNYMYLLNPDTRVHPQAIGTLLSFFDEHPAYGVAGSYQVRYNDVTWSFPNEWTNSILANAASQGLQPILDKGFTVLDYEYVQGAAMMVRTSILERVGMFNPFFGTFFEETDLCRRCRLSGSGVALVLESRIQHQGGGNWKQSRERNLKRDFLFLRNQLAYLVTDPCAKVTPYYLCSLVSHQIYLVFTHGEDLIYPLWKYPRVVSALLWHYRDLSLMRRTNRKILHNSLRNPQQLRNLSS